MTLYETRSDSDSESFYAGRYFHKLILKSSYLRSYHSVFENFVVLEIDFQEIWGSFDSRRFRPAHDLIMMFLPWRSWRRHEIQFSIRRFSFSDQRFCSFLHIFSSFQTQKYHIFSKFLLQNKNVSKLRLCLSAIS